MEDLRDSESEISDHLAMSLTMHTLTSQDWRKRTLVYRTEILTIATFIVITIKIDGVGTYNLEGFYNKYSWMCYCQPWLATANLFIGVACLLRYTLACTFRLPLEQLLPQHFWVGAIQLTSTLANLPTVFRLFGALPGGDEYCNGDDGDAHEEWGLATCASIMQQGCFTFYFYAQFRAGFVPLSRRAFGNFTYTPSLDHSIRFYGLPIFCALAVMVPMIIANSLHDGTFRTINYFPQSILSCWLFLSESRHAIHESKPAMAMLCLDVVLLCGGVSLLIYNAVESAKVDSDSIVDLIMAQVDADAATRQEVTQLPPTASTASGRSSHTLFTDSKVDEEDFISMDENDLAADENDSHTRATSGEEHNSLSTSTSGDNTFLGSSVEEDDTEKVNSAGTMNEAVIDHERRREICRLAQLRYIIFKEFRFSTGRFCIIYAVCVVLLVLYSQPGSFSHSTSSSDTSATIQFTMSTACTVVMNILFTMFAATAGWMYLPRQRNQEHVRIHYCIADTRKHRNAPKPHKGANAFAPHPDIIGSVLSEGEPNALGERGFSTPTHFRLERIIFALNLTKIHGLGYMQHAYGWANDPCPSLESCSRNLGIPLIGNRLELSFCHCVEPEGSKYKCTANIYEFIDRVSISFNGTHSLVHALADLSVEMTSLDAELVDTVLPEEKIHAGFHAGGDARGFLGTLATGLSLYVHITALCAVCVSNNQQIRIYDVMLS